jgi:hypothetical protein
MTVTFHTPVSFTGFSFNAVFLKPSATFALKGRNLISLALQRQVDSQPIPRPP